MWPVLGVVAVAIVILFVDVPGLWKKRLYKDLIVFAVLLAAGTGLGITEALNRNIPNPLDWVSYVFKPAGDWIMRVLK